MLTANRRILLRLAGACVIVVGILGIWMASRKSTATGDLLLTNAKENELIAGGADLTISMNDIQGLYGGHSLEVRLDGRASGSSVRIPAEGESGMQTIRFEGKIDAARARALIERCVNDGALEVRRSREVGVPDEVRIVLSVRATTGGVTSERSNWLWLGELKDQQNFRTSYEDLKSLARELAKEK